MLLIFTARRVCIPWTLPWQMSVRLSVRHCLNGYTYPQSIFIIGYSGSPTILVFPYQTGWKHSDRDPLKGASNARECEKNHDFRPISRFISELMQDRAIYYGRRIGNPIQAFEWYQFEWPSVTYYPDFKVTIIIQRQITRKWYNIKLYLRRPTNK